MNPLGLALALAPGLAWLLFLRRKDAREPEPWALLFGVLLLGAGAAFLIGWARPRVESFVAGSLGLDLPWAEAFLATALPEELAKLAAVAIGALGFAEWDEPLDGILYGAAAALGFASVENVYYLLESGSLGVVAARAFTAELGHLCFTATGAFLLGLWKLGRPRRAGFLPAALALPVALHGSYDLLLGAGRAGALAALLVLLPLCLALVSAKLRWAQQHSPHAP